MNHKAFTLLELIFVIVIIGVLSAVAIPQFKNLTDNAKISAELSTASSIQSAIEACHGDWIISDCDVICGKDINSSEILEFSPTNGYPLNTALGTSTASPINRILKNAETTLWYRDNTTRYYGSASHATKGTSHCKSGKPCIGKYWEYDEDTGIFKLVEP